MTGTGMIHGERRDDLAAYALGALGVAEASEVEAHLATCEPCADYVRWLRPAVDLLPASVEQLDPPTSLRESLMGVVRGEAAAVQPAASAPAVTSPSRWRSWRGVVLRPATVLAALAVLAAGALTGYLVSASGTDSDERSLVTAQAARGASDEAIAATVEYGAGDDAILQVARMPDPAPGNVYQAWISRDGTVEPAAAFLPNQDGASTAALGDTLEGADAVLVTEEPRPDRKVPTSAPVLRAPLG